MLSALTYLRYNQITGTFPSDLCEVANCEAKAGNPNLVAPCGSTDCCNLGDGAACPTPEPTPKPTPCNQVEIFGQCISETRTSLRAHPASPSPARRATDPRRRRTLVQNQITGPIPTEIGLLTALTDLMYNQIAGPIPAEIGLLYMMLTDLRAPPRPRRPARRATAPRRRRQLEENQITGTFPPALCYVATCQAAGNPNLVAPCGSTGCCGLGDGAACPVMIFGKPYDPETTTSLDLENGITGSIPPEIGQLTALTSLRVPPAYLNSNQIDGPIPTEIGQLTALTDLRVPPRPRRPARRATAPRRRRIIVNNEITGTFPTEIGQLTALWVLRVPPASPTPGAPRDRP
ncbi:hypothetical protein JL720_8264 [Aureococcus anophagefferens]|nr:hypothetical protein JL720_8264 [Aureococcus anophagefferens]